MATRTNKRTGEVQEMQPDGSWKTIVPPSQGAPALSVQTKGADPTRPATIRKTTNEADASAYAPAQAGANVTNTAADTEKARVEAARIRQQMMMGSIPEGMRLRADGSMEPIPLSTSPVEFKQKQSAQALLRAAGVDLVKGIDPVSDLIRGSTSGKVQHLGAEAYGGITGDATSGMENIGKLKTLVSDMVLQLTGGGLGNQVSDADRQFIIERVGDLANPDVPANQRLAAWEAVKRRMGNVIGVKSAPLSDQEIVSGLQERVRRGDKPADTIQWLIDSGHPPNKEQINQIIAGNGLASTIVDPPQGPSGGGFANSPLGQGLSGANEGLASVLGAPADLSTGLINAGTGAVNALAGTNIPAITTPFLGSDQIKGALSAIGSINPPTPDGQFARRVGQSVGAAAVPLGGPATTLPRYGAQLLTGLAGGVGGATAQRAFPGNPVAEILGELIAGGASAKGISGLVKRNAQKAVAAAVPTIPQLKQQAGDLYRAAESRGVVADPARTQKLADDMRGALTDEGRISPTGRVTEAYPKAKEALQLVGDYAGRDMSPTQMQTVRKVIGDGLASSDPTERRLSGILTDVFDNFANPLAPELKQARGIASRYLTAEQLARARELAGSKASQFTGSGFENALRTEYRGLDRASIKGQKHFTADVNDAIEKVARGTPVSNFFRGMGRLAPTGPVSMMGSVVPAMGVTAATNPVTGGMFGAALAGSGILGRTAATHMGIRAADDAELIARNGGNLPQVKLSPKWEEIFRRIAAGEALKYLPHQDQAQQ